MRASALLGASRWARSHRRRPGVRLGEAANPPRPARRPAVRRALQRQQAAGLVSSRRRLGRAGDLYVSHAGGVKRSLSTEVTSGAMARATDVGRSAGWSSRAAVAVQWRPAVLQARWI